MTILSSDLQVWPWPQMFQMAHLKENNCAKLFWNPCINVEFMVLTSSIYDHFIIQHSSVTLTFNLLEQMFQMALLLLKKYYAKIFWNPCINVEVMARTSSIMTILSFVLKCDLNLQPTWRNVSNGTTTPQREQLCQIILKSMHKCGSYGLDKLNLCDLQDKVIGLPFAWVITAYKQSFHAQSDLDLQASSMVPAGDTLVKTIICAKQFWNPTMQDKVMGWTQG